MRMDTCRQRCPQYNVTSRVWLNATATGQPLANASDAPVAIACPLPSFGGNNSATLLVQRTWDW